MSNAGPLVRPEASTVYRRPETIWNARLLWTLKSRAFLEVLLQPDLVPTHCYGRSLHLLSSWIKWPQPRGPNRFRVGPCGRQKVALLGRETFLRNKRAAARPKDLADIDALAPGESE